MSSPPSVVRRVDAEADRRYAAEQVSAMRERARRFAGLDARNDEAHTDHERKDD